MDKLQIEARLKYLKKKILLNNFLYEDIAPPTMT